MLDASFKDLFKKLLHIEDTPERTALAYSLGIFLGFSPFLGFHTLTALAHCFFIQLEPGSDPFRSLVKHSMVDCSLLYDRHMGGDVGNGISNRKGEPQGDVPIGNGSGIHEFGFLESGRLPMGPSPLFCDRVFDPCHSPRFGRLPSLFEMD